MVRKFLSERERRENDYVRDWKWWINVNKQNKKKKNNFNQKNCAINKQKQTMYIIILIINKCWEKIINKQKNEKKNVNE